MIKVCLSSLGKTEKEIARVLYDQDDKIVLSNYVEKENYNNRKKIFRNSDIKKTIKEFLTIWRLENAEKL